MKPKSVLSRLSEDSAVTLVGFGLACAVLLAGVALTDRNTRRLTDATGEVDRGHRALAGLERLLSTLKDAETGQRGFVVSGNPAFLQPCDEAPGRVRVEYDEVRSLAADDPAQQARLAAARELIDAELAKLAGTVALSRTDAGAAVAAARAGRGLADLGTARGAIAEVQIDERRRVDAGVDRGREASRQTVRAGLLTGALGLAVVAAAFAPGSRTRR